MVVPGSGLVKEQAEAEELDSVFTAMSFEWREPLFDVPGDECRQAVRGRALPRPRTAFEGRQGRGGRTHLVSPEMAAAAAVTGSDRYREFQTD